MSATLGAYIIVCAFIGPLFQNPTRRKMKKGIFRARGVRIAGRSQIIKSRQTDTLTSCGCTDTSRCIQHQAAASQQWPKGSQLYFYFIFSAERQADFMLLLLYKDR
ncbi:hypothetical protein PISMIDRAFT_326948 [Pisolithus microcarpus 441]|uniref:Uncharacterized protein n=1 Tax=Pisolithus microcarpus 441 TaxID=765257 RepID=A0A0D0A198_9AGAM|nr:hypothetical protein PISMIDRAFT_326948 [Pisolithus microcarpus 441]